jgi:hypothetical protein
MEGSGSVQIIRIRIQEAKNMRIRNTELLAPSVVPVLHLFVIFCSVQEIGVQVDGAALVPQAAAILSAYESHFSQEYGQQRVQGINLAKVSSERKQGCGSVFI